MYTVSELFEEYAQSLRPSYLVKADIAGTEYGSDTIVEFKVENYLAMGEQLELGRVLNAKLILKLKTLADIPANAPIKPYVALTGSEGPTDWLPMGEFYVDSRQQSGDVLALTCWDKIRWADDAYVSGLSYPATMQDVWDEICDALEYDCDETVEIDESYMIPAGPAGFSCRQVMGFIAAAHGACVYAGKDGAIQWRRFAAEDTPVMMIGTDYVRARRLNPPKTFTRIVTMYDPEDNLVYEAGTGDADHTLQVYIPWATQEIADNLLAQLNGYAYDPIQIDALCWPQLEPGDRIAYDGAEVNPSWDNADIAWEAADFPWGGVATYETVALNLVWTFTGGLKTWVESPARSAQQSEFRSASPVTQAINRLGEKVVKLGKPYYGVMVTREVGLTVEREDHAAKVVLNADELSFYKDSSKVLWFDPVNDRYEFNGHLQAASGTFVGALQGGTIEIGSSNNVFKADSNGIYLGHANFGDAPFRVTPAGAVTASNINITGGSIAWSAVTGAPTSSWVNPSYITSTKITSTTIESPSITGGTITGGDIVGGTITSGTVITVGTNLTVGDNIYLGGSSSSNGSGRQIRWASGCSISNASDGIGGFAALTLSAVYVNASSGLRSGGVTVATSSDISSLQGQIDALVSTVNGHTSSLSSLSGTVSGHASDISSINSTLSGKADKGSDTDSAGGHNHGINNGTQLALNGGGFVTWVVASGHVHEQN